MMETLGQEPPSNFGIDYGKMGPPVFNTVIIYRCLKIVSICAYNLVAPSTG